MSTLCKFSRVTICPWMVPPTEPKVKPGYKLNNVFWENSIRLNSNANKYMTDLMVK